MAVYDIFGFGNHATHTRAQSTPAADILRRAFLLDKRYIGFRRLVGSSTFAKEGSDGVPGMAHS